MKLRNLKNNVKGVINLSIVLMIGIAFVGLSIGAFIVYTLRDSLGVTDASDAGRTITNVSTGFDSTINLVLVAITIFILALAISALLLLRQR